MKANAPEKIYVVDATFPDYVDFDGSPINTKRIDDHDIEYTRTDAFIEKACDAYCAICDTKECEGCAECCWVIKFRRQLEKL